MCSVFAARVLGRFKGDSNVASTLASTASGDPAYRVRAAALLALAEVKAPGAFDVLSAAVRSDSPDNMVRDAALRGMGELGDKVDQSSREQIEAAIKDVRESLTSEDAAEIRSKSDALQTAFQQVSEQIYSQAAQEQQTTSADGATQNGAGEEEVVDAEVVDDEQTS